MSTPPQTCPATPPTLDACSSVTPPPKGECPPRPSSPQTCSICLGDLENMSTTDKCLHKFCFTCLLEWAKVRPVCPLCKVTFKAIIHSIKSDDNYESYPLPQMPIPTADPDDRYLRFRAEMGMGRRLRDYRPNFIANHTIPPEEPEHVLPNRRNRFSSGLLWRYRRGAATSDFRREIYRRNLYVNPASTVDVTGRYRECSPHWYRNNPAQKHRLVPWLNRELNSLLDENTAANRSAFIIDMILNEIEEHDIRSEEVKERLQPYLGIRTEHFQHEFYNFARSVFDLIGYDRHAQYDERQFRPGPPQAAVSNAETLVISSSSSDDDVEFVEEVRGNTIDNLTNRIRERLQRYGRLTPRIHGPKFPNYLMANAERSPEHASVNRDESESIGLQALRSSSDENAASRDLGLSPTNSEERLRIQANLSEPSTSKNEPSTSRGEPSTSQVEPSTSRGEPSTSRGEPSKELGSSTIRHYGSSDEDDNTCQIVDVLPPKPLRQYDVIALSSGEEDSFQAKPPEQPSVIEVLSSSEENAEESEPRRKLGGMFESEQWNLERSAEKMSWQSKRSPSVDFPYRSESADLDAPMEEIMSKGKGKGKGKGKSVLKSKERSSSSRSKERDRDGRSEKSHRSRKKSEIREKKRLKKSKKKSVSDKESTRKDRKKYTMPGPQESSSEDEIPLSEKYSRKSRKNTGETEIAASERLVREAIEAAAKDRKQKQTKAKFNFKLLDEKDLRQILKRKRKKLKKKSKRRVLLVEEENSDQDWTSTNSSNSEDYDDKKKLKSKVVKVGN